VTAEGPLSLESMLEAGNLLIADPASTADATRDRSVAGLLMSEAAVRDIAAAKRLEPPSGIMAIRPIKPNPRSDALRVAIRTVPRSGEKVGAWLDGRPSLVITVEEGRGMLSRRAATPAYGPAPTVIAIGLTGHAHEHDDAYRHLARSQNAQHDARLN
jgi:hypothetical protein